MPDNTIIAPDCKDEELITCVKCGKLFTVDELDDDGFCCECLEDEAAS